MKAARYPRAAAGSLAIHGHSSPEFSVADDGESALIRTPAGRLLLQSVRKVVQAPEVLPPQEEREDDTIVVIGFNYNYLSDVLGAIRGETAVIEINDEFSPTVITSPAEPGAIFVVMPMRV